MGVRDRLVHAYNAFLNRDPIETRPFAEGYTDRGPGYSSQPFRARFGLSGERSIQSSIYVRMAIDCATVDIRHVKLDDQDRYVDLVRSGLHNCLNVEANLDQSGRAFLQDLFMSLFEHGDIAVLPVDMSSAPANGGLFDVQSMRVATVVQWYPQHVRVEAYNDRTGRREQVTVNKRHVALIENPLYSVMNEPNSTLQRLVRKLNLLDNSDDRANSGKLDMVIQLPYPIRSEARRQDAAQRRQDIEMQLNGSQYGIAYIDATEKVTQLNRPLENNLLKQVEYLLELLYTQLGITPAVMNGTASESEMLNYINRTVEPVLAAVAGEFKRKFLTKTARSQGHSIEYFRDPFKLVPMAQLAELADKFTRNEIVTSNEFRGFIGMRPSADPKADELRNSNMPYVDTMPPGEVVETEGEAVPEENPFDSINKTLDEVFEQIGVEE